MRVNKYYPFAFLYFFVNSAGLPHGLLFTALLTPLFYIWLIIKKQQNIILIFLLLITPFFLVHVLNKVDVFYYFRSIILLFTVYIFCYTFYVFINNYPKLEIVFKKLLVTNFILTFIALLTFASPLREYFWMTHDVLTDNITNFPRLSMFTYEPSVYALLLVPIIYFYILKFILQPTLKSNIFATGMVILPLALSFSLGVISAIIFSVCIFFLLNILSSQIKKGIFNSFFTIVCGMLILFFLLFLFYRDNPLFIRVENVLEGVDSSGRGRTSDAFFLAYTIAELKSIWWGVGPGQVKIVGYEPIMDFYNYPTVDIPISIANAVGDTLATFGFIGLGIRFFLEIYLFFKTRVYSNHYRMLLFTFIFIYQFTGSNLVNIVEYVIWILAFSNVFPEFDKKTESIPPYSNAR